MSIQFFITPYKPTQWKTATSDLQIDPVQFEQAFRNRWNKAEINPQQRAVYYGAYQRMKVQDFLEDYKRINKSFHLISLTGQ